MAWTVENLIWEIHDLLGDPTDFFPFTEDAAGNRTVSVFNEDGRKALRTLNEAQRRIFLYKDPRNGNRIFRTENFLGQVFLQLPAGVTGTVDLSSTVTQLGIGAGNAAVNDYYAGWIITVGSETRLVVSSSGSTVYVARAFSNNPQGETFTVRRPWVETTQHRFEQIFQVRKADTGTELERAPKGSALLTEQVGTGDPSQYVVIGERIYFNSAGTAGDWFEVIGFSMPSDLSTVDDVSELPTAVHYALVLWALGWGNLRQQDLESRQMFRYEFNDLLARTASPEDIAAEWNNRMSFEVETEMEG